MFRKTKSNAACGRRLSEDAQMTELERVKEEDERLARERKKIVRDGPKLTGTKLEARLERTWSGLRSTASPFG